MFGRRKTRSVLTRLGHVLWPRTGWKRAGAYIGHRVRRLPGSPYNIAAGFACGAAISFTPLLGLHFVIASLGAWLLGGNLIASAIGTVVGNPWTFPIIWIASYRLGAWALGMNGNEELPDGLTMGYIRDNPDAVLLPMMAGGVPMAIVAWFVSFWVVRRAVARYQHMRLQRIRRRAEKRMVEQIDQVASATPLERRSNHGG